MKFLHIFLISLIAYQALGQQTGKVDYKHIGVSFIIPENWVGQESDGAYIMGSNTIPGMILIIPHDKKYSLEDIKQQAQQGLSEGESTYFNLNSSLENIGPDAVGGSFSGIFNYEQAQAYIIGVINPHGFGLTILAVTTPQYFNNEYKNYAMTVKNGLSFYKAETGSIIDEWKQFLTGTRLSFRESYYSAPATEGSMSGSYNLSTDIHLCADGYFNFNNKGSVDISNDTGSGAYTGSKDRGQGTWELLVDAGANVILRLNYYDGNYSDYTLTYQNERLFLNGERYFRTDGPECY